MSKYSSAAPTSAGLPDWLLKWAGLVARSLAGACRDDRRALADDLLQEGLLGAWAKLAEAAGKPNPVQYLKARARGAMLDHLRATDGVARVRTQTAADRPLLVLRAVSLDAPLAAGADGTLRDAHELGRAGPEPDDFADFVRSVLPGATAREVRVCELVFRDGYDAAGAARELGVDPSRVRHCLQDLRARAARDSPT